MEEQDNTRKPGAYFDGYKWVNQGDETEESSQVSELAYELSPREKEVLSYLPSKLTAKQMAANMGISHRTVQFHVDSLYWKLGCSGRTARTQACAKGRKYGLIR